MAITWRKSLDGLIAVDGRGDRWRIQGPIMAKAMFWVRRNGHRYTPTGKYDDAVSFKTVKEAKGFVDQLILTESGIQ
jgi:hypothetical protein